MGDPVDTGRPQDISVSPTKTALFLILGIVVLFLYGYFFVDFENFKNAISTINPIFILLAFAMATIGLLFYATTWHFLTRAVGAEMNWRFTYPLTLSSVFFNVMIPSASLSGEAYRTYILSKSPFSLEKGVASIVLHRILALLPFIFGLTVGMLVSLLIYPLSTQVFQALVSITAFFLLILLLVVYFISRAERAAKLVHLIGKLIKIGKVQKKMEKIENRILEGTKKFSESLSIAMARKRDFAVAVTTAFLYWLFDMSIIIVLFAGFGVHVPIFMILFVYTLTILLQSIPVMIPGMLGFADMIRTEFFSMKIAGVPKEIAFSVSLLTDMIVVFYYSLIGFIGLLILNWKGFKLNRADDAS